VVNVLPTFGNNQAAVETAAQKAIDLWNAGCGGSSYWPSFSLGSSVDDASTIAIVFQSGPSPIPTGKCPNGTDFYPPASNAGFNYGSTHYSHGIVVFGRTGWG